MAAVTSPESSRLLQERIQERFGRFGILQGTGALQGALDAADGTGRALARSLGWPELERVLPDHGLPRGVVEIASPVAKQASPEAALRGGATTIALSALRAAHEAASDAWCAWVTTPSRVAGLYAPSAAQAGVDLDRLLVVRADPAQLARAVVKVTASGAFDVVVVDAFTGLEGRLDPGLPERGMSAAAARRAARPPKVDGSLVVRKLALAAEESGATIVLLTNAYAPRPMPWPVALRLEVERRPEAIAVRVTKDRRGRVTGSGLGSALDGEHDMRGAMHVVRVP